MIIRLKVFEQTLSIVDTKSVPRKGSKDYLVLHFLFSSDWKDLNKICYLQHGAVSQPIDVVDNLVEVPEWFTEQDSFDVTLFGKSGTQEVPTNVVSLRLEKSNTLWEQNAPDPQPSWLAKVVDLNNHPSIPGENGYWLIWDTDKGAYVESELPLPPVSVGPKGEQGPQGEQGPKGDTGEQGPAGAGVPDGGTAGQLLSKTESGTEWIDPPQSGAQSDWNQNDDTQPDYVKNRPFYTGDPVGTVIVEESTLSFADDGGIYLAVFKSTFMPTVGETYKVSWDGTVYECTCVDSDGTTVIGNLSIRGYGSDTGEPFILEAYGDGFIYISTADASTSHTISISSYAESVVKIDQKYLPVASETEPGIISVNFLSNVIMQQVKDEYFMAISTKVLGYENAVTIEKYAAKNNNCSIFSPGKFSGAVLSCYNDAVNKYITSVLSGSESIECWKFSHGSTTMEQLWGIYKDGVVISSSTAGSTKKFKITVDDSGTLTTTEVT